MKDQFLGIKKHIDSHIGEINSDTRLSNFDRITLFETTITNIIDCILGTELTKKQKNIICIRVKEILEEQRNLWSN